MYYSDFYTTSALDDKKLISACGDRSVLILDGRETLTSQIKHSIEWAKKHNYVAFTINKGASFTRSNQITDLIKLN